MSDPGFYLRMRGQVTGPYELSALRAMVRRGTLSRIHELSADGTAWAAAGSYGELFSQPAGGMVAIVAAPALSLERRTSPAPAVRTVRKYFYRQEGRTFGPVPLPILQKLAESGKLYRDAQVWPPEDKTPIAARELAELRFEPEVESAKDIDSDRTGHAGLRRGLFLSMLASLPMLAAALVIFFLHYRHWHVK